VAILVPTTHGIPNSLLGVLQTRLFENKYLPLLHKASDILRRNELVVEALRLI